MLAEYALSHLQAATICGNVIMNGTRACGNMQCRIMYFEGGTLGHDYAQRRTLEHTQTLQKIRSAGELKFLMRLAMLNRLQVLLIFLCVLHIVTMVAHNACDSTPLVALSHAPAVIQRRWRRYPAPLVALSPAPPAH